MVLMEKWQNQYKWAVMDKAHLRKFHSILHVLQLAEGFKWWSITKHDKKNKYFAET